MGSSKMTSPRSSRDYPGRGCVKRRDLSSCHALSLADSFIGLCNSRALTRRPLEGEGEEDFSSIREKLAGMEFRRRLNKSLEICNSEVVGWDESDNVVA